jgi:hypothetical protein
MPLDFRYTQIIEKYPGGSMPVNCDSPQGGACRHAPKDFAFAMALRGTVLIDIKVSTRGIRPEGGAACAE